MKLRVFIDWTKKLTNTKLGRNMSLAVLGASLLLGPVVSMPQTYAAQPMIYPAKGFPSTSLMIDQPFLQTTQTDICGRSDHCFYYVGGGQLGLNASGASVAFTQAQPIVDVNDFHSLTELAVTSSDGKQIVEVGWTVARDMYSDGLPHLFVFHWKDGSPACYNEPWAGGFWIDINGKQNPNPAQYLALVKETARQAWAIWPNVKILVAADTIETVKDPSGKYYDWRSRLLAADTDSPHFLSKPLIHPTVHNYVSERKPDQTISPACWWQFDRYNCAYDAFQAHGNLKPTVWITEFGWESGVVGLTNQATYTQKGIQIMSDSGRVDKAYSFMFTTDNSWSYNWLDTNNNCKPICSGVKSLIQAN